MAAPVIAAGLLFACTPTHVADGDGPIWCAEGPRIRLAGIAARERDGSCRPGHPCPTASADAAMSALVGLLGGSRGRVRFGGARFDHARVRAPTMRCLSSGNGKGARTAAFCQLADGRNLNCAMLATRTVVRWDRYWRSDMKCPR
ncbi:MULTISPECIES: hypothetical protein [unclassified Sphingomonas]|jgi:endonuclease YncB( thermonuclease family)|uniref:hypothetical protein n=1 Tax=unclassified Sphingomonas TaxID=196159 RepID=UPI0010F5C177|nr:MULTISPECIES: hypothetical protein [unclassified Sphingomonas]